MTRKIRPRNTGFLLAVGSLLLSILACNLPTSGGTEAPVPEAVVTVTAAAVVPTATPEPTATSEPTTTPAPDVSYEGVSFSYDPSLADDVTAQTIPAVDEMEGGPTGPVPQHLQFTFEGYPLEGYPLPDNPATLVVYPVADFEAVNEIGADVIAAHREFMTNRPAQPEDIPFLPLYNAAQIFTSNVQYLDFQNGTGVRFVTTYAQAFISIDNRVIFYTYQGMTADGAYYVALKASVTCTALPDEEPMPEGADFDAWAETYRDYIQERVQQLNAQPPSGFTPDLSVLDALVQSIQVQ
jgi:hypothetical protein